MTAHRHLKLLLIVTLAWFGFWVLGLPDYYRQYAFTTMLLFDAALLPPLWAIVWLLARRARPGRALATSLWLSFYITLPLLLYDALYCGLYLGYGLAFLWEFWYLSVYYLLPWLLFPATGWLLDRPRRR